jgi:hypothetical protein
MNQILKGSWVGVLDLQFTFNRPMPRAMQVSSITQGGKYLVRVGKGTRVYTRKQILMVFPDKETGDLKMYAATQMWLDGHAEVGGAEDRRDQAVRAAIGLNT